MIQIIVIKATTKARNPNEHPTAIAATSLSVSEDTSPFLVIVVVDEVPVKIGVVIAIDCALVSVACSVERLLSVVLNVVTLSSMVRVDWLVGNVEPLDVVPTLETAVSVVEIAESVPPVVVVVIVSVIVCMLSTLVVEMAAVVPVVIVSGCIEVGVLLSVLVVKVSVLVDGMSLAEVAESEKVDNAVVISKTVDVAFVFS